VSAQAVEAFAARGARGTRRALALWCTLGWAGLVALPWYFLQDRSLMSVWGELYASPDAGAALAQALRFGRPWLVAPMLGLALCTWALAWMPGRAQGLAWVLGAGGALAALLVTGFAITASGWSFQCLTDTFGTLPQGQPGMGLGAASLSSALLVLLGAGLARRGAFRGDVFVAAAVVACAAALLLFIALPVGRAMAGAFIDDRGAWSVAVLTERLFTDRIWGLGCVTGGVRCGVAWNTLFLAVLTATGTAVMGALLALLTARGAGKVMARTMNLLALLPIITPPFVVGLGLILLFGRAGLFNQALEAVFGLTPTRWFYGLFGIWLAQMFAFTPIAYMILRGVVQGISPSMEEAAQTLRASRWQTFRTVTLPLMKPGLANAFLVGFVEAIADFGNPVVVGGQYSVLSTDIFFAIVGAQFDAGRAATLALVLSAFALAVFILQRRVLGRADYTTVGGKGDAGLPSPLPDRVKRVAWSLAGPWLAFTLLVYAFAFTGGFVQTWGRDYTPTFAHLSTAFDLQADKDGLGLVWAGTAWNSLFNTVKLAAIAAPICAGLGLLIAWLLARTQFRGRNAFEFGALLAFAIPGTVLGVSYILAFNVPPFELTGTALIIVLCFVFRNLPVGVRAGAASFAQLDRSLDEASALLRASTATTLRRVVLPLLKPALVSALVYSFVRSMTTVSAVIFLVTAEYELATTYIIGRVGNGDYGVALAYCTVLMVLMSLATVGIQWLVGERRLGRRSVTP
jgi:iron(III) transport system permease protein